MTIASGSGGIEIDIEVDEASHKRYKKAWKQMTSRQMKSRLSKETGVIANLIADEAKRIVPVDTGRLRASISARKVGAVARNTVRHTVVATAPYASDVEYGTGRQRAQPYMRPAYRKFQQPLRGRLGRAIREQWRNSVYGS